MILCKNLPSSVAVDNPITPKAAQDMIKLTHNIQNQAQSKIAVDPHITIGCTPAAFCNNFARRTRS